MLAEAERLSVGSACGNYGAVVVLFCCSGAVVGSGPGCVCVRVFWDGALKAVCCDLIVAEYTRLTGILLVGLGPQLPQCGVCCVLCVVCRLSFVVCRLLFVVCRLLSLLVDRQKKGSCE